MSAWNTDEMASALPESSGEVVQDQTPTKSEESGPTKAQLHGWAPVQAYDYESYNKSNKALMEAQAEFTGKKTVQIRSSSN